MVSFSSLPERLTKLTAEIKVKEQEVKTLHKAEKAAYKAYVRARAKLASKKYRDLQNTKTKKWYNLFVKAVHDLPVLLEQLEREEAELLSLKQRRQGHMAQDKVAFEGEMLNR
ncbi:hypothetical protein E8E11_009722 [Didymella keratinophila]|nr:hypothetical protein E8E11_009722 [Didymella keratinophila]